MSYIEQSLGGGETVIARGHFHWLYKLAAWIALLAPGLALVLLLGLCARQPAPFAKDDPVTWYALLMALFFLWGAFTFLKLMVRAWTTEIGVTSHRFVEKYGLFTM